MGAAADKPWRLQLALGTFGAALIRAFIRVFGRTVALDAATWLAGPTGPAEGEIGGRPYELVAEREGLTIERDVDAGLVPDLEALRSDAFDPSKTDADVRHFYEHTSDYDLDVWSEAPFPGRLFLWLIVYTVSRTMNQLNFPVFGLDLSRGMTSEVLPLRDGDGRIVHTGWYRRVKESGRVVYTGFYSTAKARGERTCVKVVFPLPSGNATVMLAPGRDAEGRFTLTSAGAAFGDPGFYRLLARGDGRVRVLHMRSLKEHFTVYTDEGGELRCEHVVRFLGMTILRLHYRMRPRASA